MADENAVKTLLKQIAKAKKDFQTMVEWAGKFGVELPSQPKAKKARKSKAPK